jgi:hypothetical protein
MTASTSTLTLPYADLPSRWGVTREQTPAGLWVVVPPVPSLRYLVKSHGWAVIPLGVALTLATTTFFFQSPAHEPAVLPLIGFYGSLFVLVTWHAWRRLRTRTVFRVTHDELTITLMSPGGRGRTVTWPRREVTDVKVNSYSGQLLVRAHGREMVEYKLSPSREVTEWVAEAVNAAVIDGKFEPDAGDAGPTKLLTTPFATGRARSILSAAGTCLVLGGALLLLVPGIQPFGLLLMIVAAVPLGMALGTQNKEFYV